MPSSRLAPVPEPIELSLEDAMRNLWEEEPGDYLRLDARTLPLDEPPLEEPS